MPVRLMEIFLPLAFACLPLTVRRTRWTFTPRGVLICTVRLLRRHEVAGSGTIWSAVTVAFGSADDGADGAGADGGAAGGDVGGEGGAALGSGATALHVKRTATRAPW